MQGCDQSSYVKFAASREIFDQPNLLLQKEQSCLNAAFARPVNDTQDMKLHLLTTAAFDMAAGVLLLGWAPWVTELLLDEPLEGVGIVAARLVGLGLFVSALAAGRRARGGSLSEHQCLGNTAVAYNVAAACLLVLTWAGSAASLGVVLWPGVFLHAVLALRCLANRAPVEN